VRDSDDFDVLSAYPVNQTEGIERKDVTTGMAPMARPRSWAGSDDIDRMAEFFAKGMSGKLISGGIPVIGGFRLLRGSRVEPDRRWRHLAPV
jgi:hypothetical protein